MNRPPLVASAAMALAQTLILYGGIAFSVSMGSFDCARSDPGWKPHGDDPVHDRTTFVR
ncbi:hypothetical protein [Catenulispora subtropica]|uniref:Uncharacterized protein n=1 Tax=Catenulispora subtropica TaxID=450798 RepID=A0ABP5DQQ2_9ACTN